MEKALRKAKSLNKICVWLFSALGAFLIFFFAGLARDLLALTSLTAENINIHVVVLMVGWIILHIFACLLLYRVVDVYLKSR